MKSSKTSFLRNCISGWNVRRWKSLNLHGGIEKFFGTSKSFFRSFISFFRTFISRFRGEFLFARWRSPISSVEMGSGGDLEVVVQ